MRRSLLTLILLMGWSAGGCAAPEFAATPAPLADPSGAGDADIGIRLLGTLRLANAKIDGLMLCGLSGLAWDEKAGLLYAVSDRGALFHLRPEFDERGFLIDARPVAAYRLRDAAGAPLTSLFADAEGLTLADAGNPASGRDAELLISFERKPRVSRYSPKGDWRGEAALWGPLRDVRRYRDPNQALEAIALTPRWGIVAGSETPLRADPDRQIRIFTGKGLFWNYPLSTAPNSALVAMEALADGGVLTLERAYVAPLRPLVISLRQTEPLPAPGTGRTLLQVTDVAILDSSRGWLPDNFEGLTRHRDRRFFMVSDDNCNLWQSTLLAYFELKAPTLAHGPPREGPRPATGRPAP